MSIVNYSVIVFPLPPLVLIPFLGINRPACRDSCSRGHGHNQQWEPFLQLSAPAVVVMEPTSEDGLALRLEALA